MSEGQYNKLKLMLGFVPQPNLQLFDDTLILFAIALSIRFWDVKSLWRRFRS